MAFVFHRNESIYVIYGETVLVSNSSQEPTVLKNPELQVPEEKEDAKEKSDSPDEECVEKDEDNSEKPEKIGNKSEKQDPNIICCCLSTSGDLLAVADHAKRLIIWRRHTQNKEWSAISKRTTKRKCIKLAYCETTQEVLAADRAGDVYSFSVSQPLQEETLLLGHLSMLLDLVISQDGKFIITSDRDEKIRVSKYPNTYNIQSYCLGHTEFVSALSLFDSKPNWLLSGSGDGTIRVWNYMTGKQLCSHSYTSDLQAFLQKENTGELLKKIPAVSTIQVSEKTGILAVLFDKVPCVGVFLMDASTTVPTLSHSQFVASSAEPWDIEINTTNQLFVLIPTEGEALTMYFSTRDKLESTITFQNLTDDETDSSVKQMKRFLKLNWDSIKECKKRDDFQHLYKQWFDNMKSYLEKKELREQEKLNRCKKKKFKK